MSNQSVQTDPYNGWGYLSNYSNYRWVEYRDPSPIELKLSEIELLRELVRNNQEAREILNKFSNHIKVEVDF